MERSEIETLSAQAGACQGATIRHPVQAAEFIACAELQHEERVIRGERSRLVAKPRESVPSHGTLPGLAAHASWLAVAALLMVMLVVAVAGCSGSTIRDPVPGHWWSSGSESHHQEASVARSDPGSLI